MPFDADLRRLTEQTALQFGALFATGRTPPAVYRADRCRACSLIEVCRPKAGLALDLMEELRPILADRLALSLFNRRQLRARDFETRDGGAVFLSDEGRRTVLTAWQERKKEERRHPFLEEAAPFGLVPHLQAQLLARHLRGDLDAYPPWIWK